MYVQGLNSSTDVGQSRDPRTTPNSLIMKSRSFANLIISRFLAFASTGAIPFEVISWQIFKSFMSHSSSVMTTKNRLQAAPAERPAA